MLGNLKSILQHQHLKGAEIIYCALRERERERERGKERERDIETKSERGEE